MSIFEHHIYEYKKGLRPLILHTLDNQSVKGAEDRLCKYNIPYIIRQVSPLKFNVFFGEEFCIKVLEQFGNKNLDQFTNEEDFILGVMLGYSHLQQCQRYLRRKSISPRRHCKDIK